MSNKIGIVTVTFNSEPVLEDFLASLTNQRHQNFVLYVVDNNSRDLTLDMLAKAELPFELRVIANQDNLGVAEGNNQGIEAALSDKCDFILLLNNDTHFPDDFLLNMLLEQDALNADLLVPKIFYDDQRDTIWCAGGQLEIWRGYAATHLGINKKDCHELNVAKKINYSPTCAMLIKHDVFDKIGLMDKQYFVYCDDTDFCIRAYHAGLTLFYTPTPVLFHKVSSLTGKGSPFSVRMTARNRVYMARKFSNLLLLPIHLVLIQFDFILRIILRMESLDEYKIRQKAFWEGIAMQVTK
ncbi:glycosyltransferase family 2 protein [Aeromonas veronii]|uniref:glycosyltransferase family 2 protein n=1 Tax=Aeromonas veronii TaxID=654 RepID=UPI003D25259E